MKNETGKSILNAALVVTAFALIIYGIIDKEVATVLNKAINICLECIGIG